MEEILVKVALLDRQGANQFEIAAECGVSQPQACYYIKKIRARYVKEQVASHAELVAERRGQLRDVRREAWRAWAKSMSNAEKQSEEYACLKDEDGEYAGGLVLVKRIEAKEGRLPDNAYLATILRTYEIENKMLGIDGTTKVEHSGTVEHNVSIDWGSMKGRPEPADPLRERRQALLAGGNGGLAGFAPTPRTPAQQPLPNPDLRFFPPEQQDADDAPLT